ncbi:MAG: outer membrane beta-barrel protein [Sediminibacterium sp.]|nr:outer membrane beta-barrel protein [Sediminibacterium sp.]
MKHPIKIFYLLLLLLFISGGIIAQSSEKIESKWRLGFLNGLSINNFTSEQPHTGTTLSYNASLFADLQLGKGWFLRGYGGYAGFGGELVTFKDDTRYGQDNLFTFRNVKQSRYTLLSIDAGIAAFYQLPSKQPWKVQLGLGGGMANQFGEHEYYEKTGEFITGVYGTVTGNQFTNRFAANWWHADAHAALWLPAKKVNWTLSCSYLLGLTSVRPEYSYIEYAGVTGAIRTNSFQLKLGISKNILKKIKKN